MIHYKIEDGQILEMDVRGSLKENLADVAMLANGIYSMLAKSRPDVAEVFRLALSAGMLPGSAIWKKQDYDGIAIVQEGK
jgi:hypothetical protein|nr:MAG TPA: hypothetical protein [Caudoviricetes sp.]